MAKIFKGMYEPKVEFPEGWEVETKKALRGGSMDIFWNNTFSLACSHTLHCILIDNLGLQSSLAMRSLQQD